MISLSYEVNPVMPLAEGQKINSPAWEDVKNYARSEALKRNVTFRWILFKALDQWLSTHCPTYEPCQLDPSNLLAHPKGRAASKGKDNTDPSSAL